MILEALEKLDAAILFIDCGHRVCWMNRRASEWFGNAEGMRRACFRVEKSGPGFCNICPTGRAIECSTPAHYQFTFEKDGTPREFEVIAVPVLGKTGRPGSVVELIMDVTGRGLIKIKHEELMARVEKLAAIGQLAAGVAHELNTPLGTISIITNEIGRILEKGPGAVPEDALREYLADMKGEVNRMRRIINDLLGFSGSHSTELVETDLNDLVGGTLEFMRKGRGPGPAASAFFDPALPMVFTDPGRFRQVMVNIVKNALDALEEQGGGRVSVSTGVDGGYARVTVEDDGPGISPEVMRRVFEPFFTTKPVGKGTGLGLSVSYGIMRDLRGEIKIVSRPGATRVDLLLPVKHEAVE